MQLFAFASLAALLAGTAVADRADPGTVWAEPAVDGATLQRTEGDCYNTDSDTCCHVMADKKVPGALNAIKPKQYEYRSVRARQGGPTKAIFDCEYWDLDKRIPQANTYKIKSLLLICTRDFVAIVKDVENDDLKGKENEWVNNSKAACISESNTAGTGTIFQEPDPDDNTVSQLLGAAKVKPEDITKALAEIASKGLRPGGGGSMPRQPSRSASMPEPQARPQPRQPEPRTQSMPVHRQQPQPNHDEDFSSFNFDDVSRGPYNNNGQGGGWQQGGGHGQQGGYDDDFDISSLNLVDVVPSHGRHGGGADFEYDPSMFGEDVPKTGGSNDDDAAFQRAIAESMEMDTLRRIAAEDASMQDVLMQIAASEAANRGSRSRGSSRRPMSEEEELQEALRQIAAAEQGTSSRGASTSRGASSSRGNGGNTAAYMSANDRGFSERWRRLEVQPVTGQMRCLEVPHAEVQGITVIYIQPDLSQSPR